MPHGVNRSSIGGWQQRGDCPNFSADEIASPRYALRHSDGHPFLTGKERHMLNSVNLRNGYAVFIAFLVVSMVIYSGSLQNPLVFDDFFYYLVHDQPQSWKVGLTARNGDYLSIYWLQRLFGEGVFPQRVANTVIHALNGALVFVLCKNLLAWVTSAPAPGSNSRDVTLQLNNPNIFYAALMASAVFLVHPVTVYDVAYLNQRSTELATMGALLTVLTFLEALARNSIGYFVGAFFFYLLALLGKEHAIMVPALCIALAVLHDGGLTRQRLLVLIPFSIACGILAYWVVIHFEGDLIVGKAPEYTANIMMKNLSALHASFSKRDMMINSIQTQATLFFNYWRFWLFPNPAKMSIDMREAFATAKISIYTLGTAIYALYGLVATWLLFSRQSSLLRLLGFCLLCPWLLFWTEFTSLRLQEIFVFYRSYLWFVFVMPLLAVALYYWRGRTVTIAWALLVVILIPCTLNRIGTFFSETAVWRDAAKLVEPLKEKRPGVERIYYNIGTAELKTQVAAFYPEALHYLLMANNYLPDSELKPQMMFNLALVYYRMEDYKEAAAVYDPLVHKVDPGNSQAWWLYGNCLERLGRDKEARAVYQAACDRDNRFACDRLREEPDLGL